MTTKRRDALSQGLGTVAAAFLGSDASATAYRERPIAFFADVLGVDPRSIEWTEYGEAYGAHRWDGTVNPLAVVCDALARGREDVGVESGTGTGKTFLAALLTLWFLACWERSRVITLAPKADQLRKYMWSEIRGVWPQFARRYPDAELLTLELRMDPLLRDKWSATGYPVGVAADEEIATRAQGAHAEHMLIILEEAPGIDPAIYAAVEQTCTSPHNLRLAIGNPNHRLDSLHKFCDDPEVTHVRVSALDHPNVVLDDPRLIPGAVSAQSVARRERRWSRGSRMFMSRVRGISPHESADSLIRMDWLVDADRRWEDEPRRRVLEQGPAAMGVDVADSPEGDEAAIAFGNGGALVSLYSPRIADAEALADVVYADARASGVDEARVGVDAVGVGASTVNRLKRLRMRVNTLHSQGAPRVWRGEEQFVNLRAQMWWQARLDLQHGRVAVEDNDELWADLTAPQFEVRAGGKIYVESKKDIKRRLGRSPNKGDAFVYWNWVRQRRAGFSGEGGTSNVSF